MREGSRTDYQTRIHRVLRHVDEHVEEDLALSRLAKVACLSPFHFHRVFKSMTGESVGGFVQRRRLEHAARELRGERTTSVLEIANRYGYDDPAAFSRAFRRSFGASATEWRRQGADDRRRRLAEEKKRELAKESKGGTDITLSVWQKLKTREAPTRVSPKSQRPTVETLPRKNALAMHYVGPYGSPDITAVWDRLMTRADRLGVVDETTECVGVVHDDPSITDRHRCRYDACVVVDRRIADEALSSVVVGGGDYLVFPFVGAPNDVDPAWEEIYARLPDCGHLPANRPNLEWYPPSAILDPVAMTFRCKLCIALKSR